MTGLKMKLDRYIFNFNFNIGFCDCTPEELIKNRGVGKIHWLKHPYKDRFFADPFILDVNDDTIVVLVEECPVDNHRGGRIVELVIDRKKYELIKRYELLRLDTHLSYPAIYKHDDITYVYPENGCGNGLKLYKYNNKEHKLLFEKDLITDLPVLDSTIIKTNTGYYLTATININGKGNSEVYLFTSNNFTLPFSQVFPFPISKDIKSSRPAGNFFYAGAELYRPAQDCTHRYGEAISIMKISEIGEKVYKEDFCFQIRPKSYKYNLGMHTINFCNQCCVVDGYGYLYPIIGRAYWTLFSFLDFIYQKVRIILKK